MYNYCFTAILFNETTCSKDAFIRGSGQMVVGFSFFRDINAARLKHDERGTQIILYISLFIVIRTEDFGNLKLYSHLLGFGV